MGFRLASCEQNHLARLDLRRSARIVFCRLPVFQAPQPPTNEHVTDQLLRRIKESYGIDLDFHETGGGPTVVRLGLPIRARDGPGHGGEIAHFAS